MRTKSLHQFIFSLFILTVFFIPISVAQEYKNAGYYYNNFDNGVLGESVTFLRGAASLEVSNESPLAGTHSLRSSGVTGVGSYKLDLMIDNSINLTDEAHGWEWTVRYKTTSNTTDAANNWKYWLVRESDVPNSKGCYLTQNGEKLSLVFYQDANNNWSFEVPVGIIANKDYVVRIQRLNKGGWNVYLDEAASATQGAYTSRVVIGWYPGNIKSYSSSLLEVSSSTASRFQFDEMKMYSMKLLISGANEVANGISNPLYPGLKNAVVYGLKFETRGYFDIYQFVLGNSGNIAGILESNTMKLNRSLDAVFGNSDDSFVADMGFWNGSAQLNSNLDPAQGFYTVGTPNGDLAPAAYWYVSANVLSSPVSNATFTFTTAPKLTSKSSEFNYSNTTSVVNVAAPTTNTGNTRDWVGGISSDWNNAANWSPATVPGVNDLAQIGVITFTEQPTVNSSKTVGNIIFGTEKVATLSVDSGATLTVNNNIEDANGTKISGGGTLTVKGTYLAKPTASADGITTATISNFNTSNFVLNTKDKAVTFNVNSNQTTVANSVQSSGSKTATLTLANAATLTLNGANPSDFKATTNAVTLNTGSTVVYNANVQQTVNTLVPYKNIVFSGTGVKKIASGTLTVGGNLSSTGGKVDLLANDTEVDFNGGAQSITDLGSDAGNGIVFKNVKFSGSTKTLSETGKFAVGVGSFLTMAANTILQTSDNLTLKASALGSASVSAIPASASIKGQVRVEKYIQGGSKDMWRTNRMLSSPVYDNSSGDRTYSFSQFIDDMIITGKGGAANGFDMAGSASAWTYVSGKSFVEVPNINTSLNVGMGAYLFYRGDRTNPTAKVTAPFLDAESIVMDFKGTLNQQDVTVPLAAANLVGNPYAATIDWNAVTKTGNVSNVIRVWNPSNRQYATFNGADAVNGGSRYVGPGQAFFVQATGNGASLTFTEDSKISNITQSKPLYNVIMSSNSKSLSADFIDGTSANFVEDQPARIRAKLLRSNTENSDETMIVLKTGELPTVDGYDVTRMGGEAVYLSSLSAEGRQMAINYMPHIANVTSVKLGVAVDHTGAYELTFSSEDIPLGYEVKLKDHYLNTITELGVQEVSYFFTVDKTIAASAGNNRFEIMFSPQTTLPVVVSSFNASKVNEGVLVKWVTASANNHSHFILQRAGENKVYQEIGIVTLKQSGNYEFLDKSPLVGYNYYRLVQVDKDGKSVTGEPIALNYEINGALATGILVYPTVITKNYTLKYNGTLVSDSYQVRISDVSGRNIFSEKLLKSTLAYGYQGVLPSSASGVYFVELIEVATGKTIGISKLIRP